MQSAMAAPPSGAVGGNDAGPTNGIDSRRLLAVDKPTVSAIPPDKLIRPAIAATPRTEKNMIALRWPTPPRRCTFGLDSAMVP